MIDKLEACISALKAIHTWASYRGGQALIPADVIKLIDRTLGEVKKEQPIECQCGIRPVQRKVNSGFCIKCNRPIYRWTEVDHD